MDSEQIKYLKEDDISEVISEALCQVYIAKPKYPIDFMGKWLLNYCSNQLKQQDMLKKMKEL